MKPKLLFGLALVLSGGLFVYSQTVHPDEVAGSKAARVNLSPTNALPTAQTNWSDIEVTVYRATGESVKLPAKSSVCRIRITTNYWEHFLVVAFVDPKNGRAWIGFADSDKINGSLDFYVESETETIGFCKDLFAGTLAYRENLITNAVPGKGVAGLIQRFTEQRDVPNMIHERWGASIMSSIDLSPYFKSGFFDPHVAVSYIGSTAIDHVELANGKFRLDFTSPAYQTKGSVWLDLKTRKVLKAVEYKKQP